MISPEFQLVSSFLMPVITGGVGFFFGRRMKRAQAEGQEIGNARTVVQLYAELSKRQHEDNFNLRKSLEALELAQKHCKKESRDLRRKVAFQSATLKEFSQILHENGIKHNPPRP